MKKIHIFGICLFTLLASSAIAEEVLWGYKKEQKQQKETYIKTLQLPERDADMSHIQSEVIVPDYISVPVPKSALRKGTIITEDHLDFVELPPHKVSAQFASDPLQIVGQQARRTLYKEKPINIADTGPVIIVKRNQDVDLVFQKHGIILKLMGVH